MYSVGKSTLSTDLARKLELPISEDQLRSNLSLFEGSALNMSHLDAIKYFLTSSVKRFGFERREGSFISDGSALSDLAVYLTAGKNYHFPLSSYNLLEWMFIDHAKNQYNHVLYLPPEISVKNDGVRPNNDEFRFTVDECIRELVIKHDILFNN